MSAERPLVSIGLPVKNGEGSIDKALDCLLAQTYGNFEIVISDNASDDKTKEICLSYAEKDKRIRYVRQDHRIPAQMNFEYVAKQASGEYFMWAADDDLWMPRFIEALVDELETHPEAGLAMTALELRDLRGGLIETVRFVGQNAINDKSYLWVAIKMATAGTRFHIVIYGLYKRALLIRALQAGFVNVPSLDRLFMMQIALATHIRYVDEILHIRTVHDDTPEIRHAQEGFVRDYAADHLAFTCTWLAIEPYIWSSSVVPNMHKPLSSLLAAAFADSFQNMLYVKGILDRSPTQPEAPDDKARKELAVVNELSAIGAHAIAHKHVSALALAYPNSPEILTKLADVKKSVGNVSTANKILEDMGNRWPQFQKGSSAP